MGRNGQAVYVDDRDATLHSGGKNAEEERKRRGACEHKTERKTEGKRPIKHRRRESCSSVRNFVLFRGSFSPFWCYKVLPACCRSCSCCVLMLLLLLSLHERGVLPSLLEKG